jgi:hypothetical protein
VKIRFQADADLNENIVKGVLRREPAIDFQRAVAAGIRGFSDVQVLELAAGEGRILVSHDYKTMPRHFSTFLQTRKSPGLILISQKTDVLTAIEDLLLVWIATEAEEWTNRMWTIPL